MNSEIKHYLDIYRTQRNFDPVDWIEKKCTMFNDYMRKCGLKSCLVSVSGGVDSAVTLGLMKHAMSMPNSPIKKILGIAQPIKSSAWALNRALECGKTMDVEIITIDQTDIYLALMNKVDSIVGTQGGDFASGQLRSYMRTPVGYYVAQLLSQSGYPCVVMGTGNQDEDGYLGYFCKAGDGVVDIQLIADLHKSEVFKIGAHLNVPESILKAAPSADLWDGQTDENELGITYDFVELYTGYYLKLSEEDQKKMIESFSDTARAEWERSSKICTDVHRRNAHKLNGPTNLNILH
ncbi:hypothetical protein WA158_001689 [Blastocystis sp. Blastoise]